MRFGRKKIKPQLFESLGCRAIVRVPRPRMKKLDKRGIESILLGHAQTSNV